MKLKECKTYVDKEKSKQEKKNTLEELGCLILWMWSGLGLSVDETTDSERSIRTVKPANSIEISLLAAVCILSYKNISLYDFNPMQWKIHNHLGDRTMNRDLNNQYTSENFIRDKILKK